MTDERGKGKDERGETADATAAAGPESADFSPEDLRAISAEITGVFPPPQDSGLVLLDVDPRRLHAYWTVTPAEMAAARRDLSGGEGRAPMVLRVHELTDDTVRPFDVEVLGLQSSQYVDLFQEGGSYRADLGLLNEDGSLVVVAESNRVDLPGPAPEAPALSPAFPEAAPERAPAPAVAAPETEAVAADTATPEIATDRPRPVEPPQPEAEGTVESPVFPEVSDTDLATFAALAHETEARFAEETPEAPRADALSAPPLEPPAPGGPAPEDAATPLETVLTYSSFELGRESVDLEVHAELHIYGRAKPGRKLTLFGRPVATRPDGSFSVRRPLPDGAVVLPLTVTTDDE